MEGIEKLPKWAQEEIVQMEAKLARSEKALADKIANKPGDIYVEHHLRGGQVEFVQGREVTFALDGKGMGSRRRVRVSVKDGKLAINADSRVAVEMNASNDFRVAFRDE